MITKMESQVEAAFWPYLGLWQGLCGICLPGLEIARTSHSSEAESNHQALQGLSHEGRTLQGQVRLLPGMAKRRRCACGGHIQRWLGSFEVLKEGSA